MSPGDLCLGDVLCLSRLRRRGQLLGVESPRPAPAPGASFAVIGSGPCREDGIQANSNRNNSDLGGSDGGHLEAVHRQVVRRSAPLRGEAMRARAVQSMAAPPGDSSRAEAFKAQPCGRQPSRELPSAAAAAVAARAKAAAAAATARQTAQAEQLNDPEPAPLLSVFIKRQEAANAREAGGWRGKEVIR